ncbi:hypothetical protein DM860_006335 [Cuscuta australis]|uniref:Uncharacterized protein n=1 Tax=Cuscuta australis TaxID=267555 RepID=A0A328D3G2_9ASTE|nr:hypothetical protein DM860_006335 [Cuscuta australis]
MSLNGREYKPDATLEIRQQPEMSGSDRPSVDVGSYKTRRAAPAGGDIQAKRSYGDDGVCRQKKRSLEKAEYLFHLVYWGPN